MKLLGTVVILGVFSIFVNGESQSSKLKNLDLSLEEDASNEVLTRVKRQDDGDDGNFLKSYFALPLYPGSSMPIVITQCSLNQCDEFIMVT